MRSSSTTKPRRWARSPTAARSVLAQHQSFKDHFSGHAGHYARFRPEYPAELFSFLAGCCAQTELAWDCATGNGQAARGLSRYFARVVATDASPEQVSAAPPSPNIEYLVAAAEAAGFESASIDLITVAQALHWFRIDRFFAEAARVLAPGGVLAVWSYERCRVDGRYDEVVERVFDLVEDYWPPERRIVEDRYRGIELPVPEIPAPAFSMTVGWTSADMTGYLRTWSATQRYLRDNDDARLVELEAELHDAWGRGDRTVTWPLTLKVGRRGD